MRALLALLLAAPAYALEPTTFHIDGYSVTDSESFSELRGNSLVWYWNGPAGGPFTVASYPVEATVFYSLSTHLSWQADVGRRINGFSVVYDLDYYASTDGLPDPGWDGAYGDFGASYGAYHRFIGVDKPLQTLQLVSEVQSDDWNADFWLLSSGRESTCIKTNSPRNPECPPGQGFTSVETVMSLRSITITPHVVSTIPEPSTYVLMLVGLLCLYRPMGWRT